MEIADSGLALHRGPKEHFTRPSIDVLFRTAAETYGPRVAAVVLSGGGYDGVAGSLAAKAAGGAVSVQDPSEAKVPALPRNVLRYVEVDGELPVAVIAEAISPRVKLA